MRLEVSGGDRFRARRVQLIEVDEGVLLRRGRVVVRVQGTESKRVLERLLSLASSDAGRSDDELLADYRAGAREAVERLLAELKARRILEPVGSDDAPEADAGLNTGESDEDVFFWHFGTTSARVRNELADRRLVLVGVNTISLALADALRRLGFAELTIVDYPLLGNLRVADPDDGPAVVAYPTWLETLGDAELDCLIATSDFGGQALLRPWNSFAVSNRLQFLPIVIRDLIALIGPLVVPGEGPCLECLHAREASHVAEPAALHPLQDHAFEGQVVNALHPSVPVVVAEVAAFELSRLYGGWSPERLVGQAIEVNLVAARMTSRRVLRLPRCAVCGPWQSRSWTSAERATLMPGIE